MIEKHIYTVEELMLDESFVSFALQKEPAPASHWVTIIREHPTQTDTFAEAKELVRLLHGGLTKNEINREIENVRRMLKEHSFREIETATPADHKLSSHYVINKTGKIRRIGVQKLVAYAAACLLVFFGVRMLLTPGQTTASRTAQVESKRFYSPTGQRLSVQLPDGSTVLLNGNSSVVYTAGFNDSKRDITLTGDAYFSVAANPAKPFVVTAAGLRTRALGTAFYVRSQQATTKGVTVELIEGKVEVTAANKSAKPTTVVLHPGEKAASTDGNTLRKEAFDTTSLQTWLSGTLEFDQTPLLTAIRQLETWYSVEISFSGKAVENQSISGRYENAALQDILKVICFSIGRQFTLAGNKVTIE